MPRASERRDQSQHFGASTLELFFDLVSVIAIACEQHAMQIIAIGANLDAVHALSMLELK